MHPKSLSKLLGSLQKRCVFQWINDLRLLFGAEYAVACVSESGENVAVFVKAAVLLRDVNLYVGVCFLDNLYTYGSSDDVHQFDFRAAVFFKKVYCGYGTAAGREHRVDDDADFFVDFFGKFAIVLFRLESVVVTVHADMTDFCSGKQCVDTVDHTESCPEDRDDGNAVFDYDRLRSGF